MAADSQKPTTKPKCGIVMPISGMDELSSEHWKEVKGLIVECAEECGYVSDLVSAADFSGVIQKRIVQNLYQNDLVICDVSMQNANVMFELGLRLAFDKATIVIVDDETKISFDTSPIEHIIYPRDLRHGKILLFKEKLKALIIGTAAKSKEPGYSTFLKDFGTFEVKGLETQNVQFSDYVQTSLEKLTSQVSTLITQSSDKAKELENDNTLERVKTVVNSAIAAYLKDNLSINSISDTEAIDADIRRKLNVRGINPARVPYRDIMMNSIQFFKDLG
ncbi:hypothetical protein [Pedobacter sp. Leaf170]|uniref:hypothetical protein n=1 Tax=Pedobacter sp. Leaf170 TaxID=2876558 RepID=UPI001E623EB1|nr:hypothetical protein [Pedobacter sp. Leaf170]